MRLETVEELRTYLEPIQEINKLSFEDDEVIKKYIVKNVDLPYGYTFAEPKPTYVIKVMDNTLPYYVFNGEGKKIDQGDDLSGLYEMYREEAYIKLEGNFLNLPGVEVVSKNSIYHNNTPLYSSTSIDDLYYVKASYINFLEITLDHYENPDKFASTFNYVDRHPIFWARVPGWTVDKWEETDTRQGIKHLNIEVSTSREGKTWYQISPSLDHIGSTFQYNRFPMQEYNLEVGAETFEEAITLLAKRIHKHYYLNGEEKN